MGSDGDLGFGVNGFGFLKMEFSVKMGLMDSLQITAADNISASWLILVFCLGIQQRFLL